MFIFIITLILMTTLVYLNALVEIDKYYSVVYRDDAKIKVHIVYGLFLLFYIFVFVVRVIL